MIAPESAVFLCNNLIESENSLKCAACRIQALCALVKLMQELQIIGKVCLRVSVLLSILALEIPGGLVANMNATRDRVHVWL